MSRIYEQLEKEKNIKQEVNRIKKFYKELTKEKMKVLEGLVNEAAFMKVSLEELREDLLNNGYTEMYENGPQVVKRERPEMKIYATLIQRYSNVMKQLIDIIPGDEKKEEEDSLVQFIAKGKIKK